MSAAQPGKGWKEKHCSDEPGLCVAGRASGNVACNQQRQARCPDLFSTDQLLLLAPEWEWALISSLLALT